MSELRFQLIGFCSNNSLVFACNNIYWFFVCFSLCSLHIFMSIAYFQQALPNINIAHIAIIVEIQNAFFIEILKIG